MHAYCCSVLFQVLLFVQCCSCLRSPAMLYPAMRKDSQRFCISFAEIVGS